MPVRPSLLVQTVPASVVNWKTATSFACPDVSSSGPRRLRYRLLPYLYTLAAEAAEAGHPWSDRCVARTRRRGDGELADPRLAAVDDAFLLGDALLVARSPPRVRAGARSSCPRACGTDCGSPPTPSTHRAWRAAARPARREHARDARRALGQPVVLVRAGTVLRSMTAGPRGRGRSGR